MTVARSEGLGRRRNLARARGTARTLNLYAVVVSAWGLIAPRPYLAAVAALAIVPLVTIALLLTASGRDLFEAGRIDRRSSVVFAIMIPGMVLGGRAVIDVHVLDHWPFLVGAALGGIGLAAALATAGPELRKPWLLALLIPLLGFYTWGLLAFGNAGLDRSEPETFRVAVRGKLSSGGRSPSYELRLEPWGPVTEPSCVEVERRLWDAAFVGDRVCVLLRPGVLGARWYAVQRCEQRH